MGVQGARPVGIVNSVLLSTSDAIGEVVVALVWDVVDPVVGAVDSALRVLRDRDAVGPRRGRSSPTGSPPS
jgi:hypothetical protein